MSVELPPLPYPADALAPLISEETLKFHYGKHHAGYVKKLNAAIAGSELDTLDLEEIVARAKGGDFNNAAQIWNHTFYWNSMRAPETNGQNPGPQGALAEAIQQQYGDLENLQKAINTKAASLFGSGWTWLVKTATGDLDIINTGNAETPITLAGVTPLLTVDVWEHAYYIDYRNDRGGYLASFWQLANWDFAARNFG